MKRKRLHRGRSGAQPPSAAKRGNPLFTRRQKRKMRQRVRHGIRQGILGIFGLKKRAGALRQSSLGIAARETPQHGTAGFQGLRAEVISALQNQGYSEAAASASTPQPSASDNFESLFRRAMKKNPSYIEDQQDSLNRAARAAGKGVKAKLLRNSTVKVTVRGQVHHFDDIHEAFGFLEGLLQIKENPHGRESKAHRVSRVRGRRRQVHQRRVHKRNPTVSDIETEKARKVFRDFHGAEPGKVSTVIKRLVEQKKYALLGRLYSIDMRGGPELKCWEANIQLCSDPDACQLFLWGGDQDIEKYLKPMFGITSDAQLLDLGEIAWIRYVTQKSFDHFKTYIYKHRLAEEGGKRPRLQYDRVNKELWIVGGDYEIKPEGIKN